LYTTKKKISKMSFQNLIKLNNFVGEAFLMNDIISIFKNDNSEINLDQKELLKKAQNYISLIEDGQNLINNKVAIDHVEKSLNAFNISIYALKKRDNNLSLNQFNETIRNSKTEIIEAIEKERILIQDMQESILLFKSIRNIFLEEANKMSNIDDFFSI